MLKIDIFAVQDDVNSREEMELRESYSVSDESEIDIYVASAEDIILRKLHWHRLGGGVSERQWNDVMGVIQSCKKLDFPYLERGARELKVSDLLKRALEKAKTTGIPDP